MLENYTSAMWWSPLSHTTDQLILGPRLTGSELSPHREGRVDLDQPPAAPRRSGVNGALGRVAWVCSTTQRSRVVPVGRDAPAAIAARGRAMTRSSTRPCGDWPGYSCSCDVLYCTLLAHALLGVSAWPRPLPTQLLIAVVLHGLGLFRPSEVVTSRSLNGPNPRMLRSPVASRSRSSCRYALPLFAGHRFRQA